MSRLIGGALPAPLRFDLGSGGSPADAGRAVLLVTVDEDGSPRVCVLSSAEIAAVDERTLRFDLHAESATCANARSRRNVSVWLVLDAAAYTIKGAASAADRSAPNGWQPFDMAVDAVWCDFEERAPMVSGPTYRRIEKG